jgi:TPR repeat protein
MYETGRGGLRADREQAIRLYRVAAPGDDYAREQLTRLGVTQ